MKTQHKKSENKNQKKAILIVSLLFLTFFSILIIYNEYTINSGEKVLLKTIPVDPRDLLRGDYVILSYQIEQPQEITSLIKNNNLILGDNFYINLNVNPITKQATFQSASLKNQKNQISIKATIDTSNGGFNIGIGKYFVPENKGRQLEVLTNELGILTSIDKFGNAKIIDIIYENQSFQFE